MGGLTSEQSNDRGGLGAGRESTLGNIFVGVQMPFKITPANSYIDVYIYIYMAASYWWVHDVFEQVFFLFSARGT